MEGGLRRSDQSSHGRGAAAQRPEFTWKGGCGAATRVHMEGGLRRSDQSSHGRGWLRRSDQSCCSRNSSAQDDKQSKPEILILSSCCSHNPESMTTSINLEGGCGTATRVDMERGGGGCSAATRVEFT